MSKNLWDDEPFRDGQPVFDGGQWKEPETYSPVPETMLKTANAIKQAQKAIQEEEYDVEELTNQVAEDEEEDFTEVLSDARLRLEQGKLYEMIMNHELFSDVDADPRAAKSVQKQIRAWARMQMEIMLGMRRESAKVERLEIDFPFNSLEVDTLKKLAFAATKGATQNSDNYVPEVKRVEEEIPVVHKKKTLNSIGNSKSQPKPQPKAKPLQKQPEPIQRTKVSQGPEKQGNVLTGKQLHEMSDQERVEYLRGVAERNKARSQVIPPDRAPMPDYAHQEMLALSQVSRAVGSPQKGNLSALIMANLKNQGKV